MGECDTCGQEDPHCSCYTQELEERITVLDNKVNMITHMLIRTGEYLKELEK